MAKTVDNYSTIEDFRRTYNELAVDVGDIRGLRTTNQATLTDAVNSIEDKSFFFQEFVYTSDDTDANDGSGPYNFFGADIFANVLKYKKDRVQVFVNGVHLSEGIDYTVTGLQADATYNQIQISNTSPSFGSGLTDGDRLTVYSYTGSYLGVAVQNTGAQFFLLDETQTIYNNNANGLIFNGSNSNLVTTLQSGFTIQNEGNTLVNGELTVDTGHTLTAPTITDGIATLSSGSITNGVNGTFSGTIQAEHLYTTDDLQVGDDATISGDLTVNGAVTLNGSTITLGNHADDNVVFNADVNTDIKPNQTGLDLGSSTQKWDNLYVTEVQGNIDGNVYSGSTLVLNNTTAHLTGTVSDISNHDTDDLTEGSSNLYFTTARARESISENSTQLAYDNSTGVLTYTQGNTDTVAEGTSNLYYTNARADERVALETGVNLDLSNQDTDELAEGSSNLYYTNTRADGRIALQVGANLDLSSKSTTNLSEGTNLYYTNTRVDNRIASASIGDLDDVSISSITAGQALTWSDSANDGNGGFTPTTLGSSTDSFAEGSNNLYFTNERAMDAAASMITTATHSNITVSYDDDANTLAFSAAAQYGDSDVEAHISEGPGIDLDTSGSTLEISASAQKGVKISSTHVELDYEVVSASGLSGTPSGTGKPEGHLWFVI
jgi:hypothetical protein